MAMNDFTRAAVRLGAITALCSSPLHAVAAASSAEDVTVMMREPLLDDAGREGVVARVALAPGQSDAVHRHAAHVFVYVLEGTVDMQVAGGHLLRLAAGDTFYESPDDIHTISRNASDTDRAVLLVFFVKNRDAPLLQPVPGP
jgi:quercetin dioxygenase-like cupin family protein